MLIKKRNLYSFVLLFFALAQLAAQDTIYIYEDVIVRDTVYLPKSFEKSKIKEATLALNDVGNSGKLILKSDSSSISIPIDKVTFQDKNIQKILRNNAKKSSSTSEDSFYFSATAQIIFNHNSLLKLLNEANSFGATVGLFAGKQLTQNLSAQIGVDYTFLASQSFAATENDSPLNGYYFSDDIPFFFEGISELNHSISVPITIHYQLEKWKPYVGAYAMYKRFSAHFLTTSLSQPLSFDVSKELNMQYLQFGIVSGISYQIAPKMSVFLENRFGKSNSIDFKKNGVSFEFANGSFTDLQFGLGIKYRF